MHECFWYDKSMKKGRWQYKGTGTKKFLSLPKFKSWKMGIPLGIIFIIIFWRFYSSISSTHCGTTISGSFCSILYLVIFIVGCIISGILIVYAIEKLVKK